MMSLPEPMWSVRYPERIVCLTQETTEVLYLLGEQQRIAGISGFTVRPPQARKEKPRVSAFTTAKIDKILELEPDLVLGFSDMQADIAAALIRHGVAVHVFNQRRVHGIFDMILQLGSIIGANVKAEALIQKLQLHIAQVQQRAELYTRRPKIYFEEWNDPMISSIAWVSELIQIAGGEDCFQDLAHGVAAQQRIIADSNEVIRRQPDIIIGSWCGKKFRPEQVSARPGWSQINAVSTGQLYEIKSANILPPGPGALSDGLSQIHQIVQGWQQQYGQMA